MSTATKLAAWAGRLHPLSVHFPIALLIVAAVIQWFPPLRSSARLLGLIAAPLAIFAVALGWLDAAHIRIHTEMRDHLFWHRWIGVTVAALAVFSAWAGRGEGPVRQRIHRIALTTCAVLVAFGAHLGGEIVYGEDYFGW